MDLLPFFDLSYFQFEKAIIHRVARFVEWGNDDRFLGSWKQSAILSFINMTFVLIKDSDLEKLSQNRNK